MSLNEGKQERKYHTFLNKKYRIDSLPCGVSIPFNVELNKVRKKSIEIVNNINPNTPSSEIFNVLEDYLLEHEKDALEQMKLMVKTVSIITEFFTDGEINEEHILKNATDEEVGEFIEAINNAQYEKKLKKLSETRKSLLSLKSKLVK